MAELIFEEFRDREFEATFLADADPNRALLDRRVICDLLGFSEGIYMAVRYLSAKIVRGTIRTWGKATLQECQAIDLTI